MSETENPLVVSNNDGDITAYRYPQIQYSPLGLFILYRLTHNRDIKGVITSKGNTTGTGKTGEMVKLCRICQRWANQLYGQSVDWSAKEFAFRNVFEYIDLYQNGPGGVVLATDELQTMIDKRRSMTHENVKFSHAWQELRFKNNVTWATAPSLHNLDKRVSENTDIWINITSAGRMNVYFLTMHDFVERLIHSRFSRWFDGTKYKMRLVSLPTPKSDPDYEYLHRLKTENDIMADIKQVDESDIKEREKEVLDTILINLLELREKHPEMTLEELRQTKIAEDVLDDIRSQQYISKLYRRKVKDDQ